MKIAVFSKAPVPGTVKTRLIPLLGADAAAALHRRLALHAIATACSARIGAVDLWCAPDTQHAFFAACGRRHNVQLCKQCEGDLGLRMRHAFARSLAAGTRVILIGTDCPALTVAHLHAAAASLNDGNDAVFIPAADGGYALIGLARCDAHLFNEVRDGARMKS